MASTSTVVTPGLAVERTGADPADGWRTRPRAVIAEAMCLGRESTNMVAATFSTVETARLVIVWYGDQPANAGREDREGWNLGAGLPGRPVRVIPASA